MSMRRVSLRGPGVSGALPSRSPQSIVSVIVSQSRPYNYLRRACSSNRSTVVPKRRPGMPFYTELRSCSPAQAGLRPTSSRHRHEHPRPAAWLPHLVVYNSLVLTSLWTW